jgi:hypothetical protein
MNNFMRALGLRLATLIVAAVGALSAIAACDYQEPSASVGACTTTKDIGASAVTCSFFDNNEAKCGNCANGALICYHIEQNFPTGCVNTDNPDNCNTPNVNCYVKVTCTYDATTNKCKDPTTLPNNGWNQLPKRTDVICTGS